MLQFANFGPDPFWQSMEERLPHASIKVDFEEPIRLEGQDVILRDEDLRRLATTFGVEPEVVPDTFHRIHRFNIPAGLDVAKIRTEVGEIVNRLYASKGRVDTEANPWQ